MPKMRNQKITDFLLKKPTGREIHPCSPRGSNAEKQTSDKRCPNATRNHEIHSSSINLGKRSSTQDDDKRWRKIEESGAVQCSDDVIVISDDDSDENHVNACQGPANDDCIIISDSPLKIHSKVECEKVNLNTSTQACLPVSPIVELEDDPEEDGQEREGDDDYDPELFTPVCEISDGVFKIDIRDEDGDEEKHVANERWHVPYYLKNFKHVIQFVLKNPEDRHLFNGDDKKHIENFFSLSESAQKLYVRMFQRKHKWLRPHKLEYQEIQGDIILLLNELVSRELSETAAALSDLETALKLLSVGELRILARDCNINTAGKGKESLISILVKHGREHKSLFNVGSSQTVTQAILAKAKQYIGRCYRLLAEPRALFVRLMILFDLPTSPVDDESGGGGHQTILQLLWLDMGKLAFPEYEVRRETVLFRGREDLIRFEEAILLEADMLLNIEAKNYVSAHRLVVSAGDTFSSLKSLGIPERDSRLPVFLRCFTACHVYVRCLSHGVDVLQKLRKYGEAVDVLRMLLAQKVYYQDARGKWWDRLALNLEYHLKQPEKALAVIRDGLDDCVVKAGHRLALQLRGVRLLNSSRLRSKKETGAMDKISLQEPVKVTIQGQLYPHSVSGSKSMFITSSPDCSGDMEIVSVEGLALQHYKQNGYSEGIHGEGTIYISVFGIFFWNILYTSLPDAFRTPYQSHPLDLNSGEFFERRAHAILSRLELLRSFSSEDLASSVKQIWDVHAGKASLVAWDSFKSVSQLQDVVKCLGSQVVAGICERLARDFRHHRSGLPDLLVWNAALGKIKAVEVKGPGDRLSPKQQLWLDYLMTIGMDVEVCHVEAVASRRLKKMEEGTHN